MNVMAVADIHLKGGFESEEADALMKSADLAIERGVDLVLVNGDVFEGVSTPNQRLVFRTFLDRLKAEGIKVVVLRGNHDQPKDLMVFEDELVVVHEKPEEIKIEITQEESSEVLQVLTIPHFNAGAVALQQDNLLGLGEQGTGLFNQIMDDYFQKVHAHSGPSIVAFHAVVSGAHLDNGMIPRENGIHLNATRLSALGCPVAGGHYHDCQEVAPNVWYSGSITRQTFGEAEGDKGVLFFRYEAGNWLRPEFVSLNPTPMMLLAATWCPELSDFVIESPSEYDGLTLSSLPPEGFSDMSVRFRYQVEQKDLATVDLSTVNAFFGNSRSLKIEPEVRVSTAVRSEEIAQAESLEDCLRVWMAAKGYDAATQAQALALLAEIQGKKEPVETEVMQFQPDVKVNECNEEILAHV